MYLLNFYPFSHLSKCLSIVLIQQKILFHMNMQGKFYSLEGFLLFYNFVNLYLPFTIFPL